MYWLLPVGVVAVASWIMSSEDEVKSIKVSPSLLENNFVKLKKKLDEENKRKILIIGQPGSGKSSLLKYITNNECFPKPIIGQKTDATHWHDSEMSDFFHLYADMIFVDSPGYDTENHPVESYLAYFPFASFDQVLFVVRGKIYGSDKQILKKMKDELEFKSIVMIYSFSENSTSEMKKQIKNDLSKVFDIDIEPVFFSAKTKEGVSEIQALI